MPIPLFYTTIEPSTLTHKTIEQGAMAMRATSFAFTNISCLFTQDVDIDLLGLTQAMVKQVLEAGLYRKLNQLVISTSCKLIIFHEVNEGPLGAAVWRSGSPKFSSHHGISGSILEIPFLVTNPFIPEQAQRSAALRLLSHLQNRTKDHTCVARFHQDALTRIFSGLKFRPIKSTDWQLWQEPIRAPDLMISILAQRRNTGMYMG